MKKLITLIVLVVLLVGVLTACSQRDTTMEDYLELEAEFHTMRGALEYTRTRESTVELQAIGGAVLHTTVTWNMVDGINEVMQVHRTRDGSGTVVLNRELIITDGGVYVDTETAMSPVMERVLEFLADYVAYLEFLSISLDDISHRDILSDTYTHIQSPDNALVAIREDFYEQLETRHGMYDIFTEEALGDYLSRDGDGVFRITIMGEAIDTYIAAVMEEFNLDRIEWIFGNFSTIADLDDALLFELEDDFVGWIRDGNLTEAELVIERWKSDDTTYHQNITLYVPGRILIEAAVTTVVGESTPITAPPQFLTQDEVSWHIDDWVFELLDEAAQAMLPSTPDVTGGEIDPAFVGTWVWDTSDDWEYIFEADGTGMRGWVSQGLSPFEWETTADGVLILRAGFMAEHWEYSFDGDVLTISSLDLPGIVYSYIRV